LPTAFHISDDDDMVISRMMTWEGHVAHKAGMKNSHTILVGKLEGKRPFHEIALRREDNIKMDLKEMR
jgi:hypothetical protein